MDVLRKKNQQTYRKSLHRYMREIWHFISTAGTKDTKGQLVIKINVLRMPTNVGN